MLTGCDDCGQAWGDLYELDGLRSTRLCRLCSRTVTWVGSYAEEQSQRLQGLAVFRAPAYQSEVEFQLRPHTGHHPFCPLEELSLPSALIAALHDLYIFYVQDLATHRRSDLRSKGLDEQALLQIDLALRARGYVLGARFI
jgi:hypothetical protein